MSQRRETDIELWGQLAKVLVSFMNTKKLRSVDLMLATRSFVNGTVRSEKLYDFIVQYFMMLGFDEDLQARINRNIPIFFFFSLAKAHPTLDAEANQEFYRLADGYLRSQMDNLDAKQVDICLDI